MAPLTGPRPIKSPGPHPYAEDPNLRDRMQDGPGSERIAAVIKKIRRAEGDWDLLEKLLVEAKIAHVLRLIAEDAFDNYRESSWTHDGKKAALESLSSLFKALTKPKPGRPNSRAKMKREQYDAQPFAGWVELVRQTIKEASKPQWASVLARKLTANPDLLIYYVDSQKKTSDPASKARRLLVDYVPLITKKRLRTATDVRRFFGTTDRQRRKGAFGEWGRL